MKYQQGQRVWIIVGTGTPSCRVKTLPDKADGEYTLNYIGCEIKRFEGEIYATEEEAKSKNA